MRISCHIMTVHSALGTHHGPVARSTVIAWHGGCGHGSNTTHVPSTHTSSGASAHGTTTHGTASHSSTGASAHGTAAHTSAGTTAHGSTACTPATHHGQGKTITGYQRDSHHANHKNYHKHFFHNQFFLLSCYILEQS
jgi:hypothetical protein